MVDNMKEYVKLDISFVDKVVLVFTGLICKDHLIIEKTENVVYSEAKQEITIPKGYEMDDKMENIPFFEIEQGETKSNL